MHKKLFWWGVALIVWGFLFTVTLILAFIGVPLLLAGIIMSTIGLALNDKQSM